MEKQKRCSGILMHISSLPGKYGIGTFGKGAYEFIDFLKQSGQKIWQILPLGHTGYGDSPYQCYSAFAGNPLFIDIDILFEKGYLKECDINKKVFFEETAFDTSKTSEFVYPLLKIASENFQKYESEFIKSKYTEFCTKNAFWLDDYSLFISLKEYFNNKPWFSWDDDIKLRDNKTLEKYHIELDEKIQFYKTIQYFFYDQWFELKAFANENEIKIFGDIPLYVAYDSADAWANSEIFYFDKNQSPIAVAGVPPDYFSETGQLWGNPLYNWDVLKNSDFQWWVKRIKANFSLYDILRIDHFRGLAAYWSVPFEEKTAINGEWVKAPGIELFETIIANIGNIPIIAEDLGVMTDDVEELRDRFNFPGMKILQFAFDSTEENDFLPHNLIPNCVVYTGTHDNDTTKGWYENSTDEQKEIIHTYFNFKSENIHWELLRLAWSSVAYMAIVPMQDILGLGSEHRMNLPGKPDGYWKWRIKKEAITINIIEKLKKYTQIYNR